MSTGTLDKGLTGGCGAQFGVIVRGNYCRGMLAEGSETDITLGNAKPNWVASNFGSKKGNSHVDEFCKFFFFGGGK